MFLCFEVACKPQRNAGLEDTMRSFIWRSLIVLLFVSFLAYSRSFAAPVREQGLSQSSPPPRIAGVIDESSLVTLRGNTHPLAQLRYDRGPAPVSMPANRLLLILSRSTEQEAELQSYLESVQDANSPNYRKFLNPDEFGKRFGVSDSDLQTVQSWLAGHGFSVNKVAKGRMAIEFSGTVGQVQGAFHTSLHSYLINGERHWANASDPQIPSALAPVVAGFASLNNFKPKTNYVLGPRGVYDAQRGAIVPALTNVDQYGDYYLYLSPADAATIYDIPTTLNANLSGTAYDGTGVTIGVAGDSNINLTENANYRATFGLAPNPTTVVVDGNDPGETGDSIEAYLDTQVSGGIAPNANVILYTAADTTLQQGLFLAIQRAIDDNQADILNVSFGECESQLGASGNQYVESLWEQAAAQGISVVVSAGDSGSAGCDNPDTQDAAYLGLAVNGLASTPYNVAVGGTDFDVLYKNFPSSFTNYVNVTNTLANHRSALKYIPEEPWNDSTYPNTDINANVALNHNLSSYLGDNIIAGGGGMSSLYGVPSWQSGFASGGNRNLPDVSILAGNGFYGALWSICTDQAVNGYADCAAGNTGVQLYLTGIGGTSASAPAFSGMLALAKQKAGTRLGQADYVVYDLAKTSYSTVFHDVTTGDNSVSCEITNGGCSPVMSGSYFMNGYNAGPGYDLASGLGSVDASQMISHWAGPGLAASTSSLQLNGGTTPMSITHGQSVQVNASVASAGSSPSGEISLVDNLSAALVPNRESIADFAVTNGAASGTTTELPGGSYSVSAHYGGSSTIAESDSNAIAVTVAPESSTTAITSVTFTDPVTGKPATTGYYGFNAYIDAQPYGNSASAAKPNGAATGTLTFRNGSTSLGAAPLNAQGTAELQTSLLPAGSNNLTASFPGDASFKASTSAPYPLTIVPAVTTLDEYINFAAGTYPFPVAVSLTTDSSGVAPTGTMTFMNGSTAVGTVPLVGTAASGTAPASGSASLATSGLPAGSYNLVAVYSGDANYAGSSSSAIAVTTNKADEQVVVTPSASTILSNQPLQVTVAPTPVNGLPAPTGTVTMTVSSQQGQTTSAPTNLVNGVATFNYPANSLIAGGVFFNATYSGDADYTSNLGYANVTVNPAGTITPLVTLIGPSGITTPPFSIIVKVTGPSGDPVPTGGVLIRSNTIYEVWSQGGLLTNGTLTVPVPTGINGGPIPFMATYMGDSNYTAGSGSTTVDTFGVPGSTYTLSPATIIASLPLTVTVTLNSNSSGYPIPTGTLTFSTSNPNGPEPTPYTSPVTQLTAGSATFTVPANSLAIGIDSLNAAYSGDSYYAATTLSAVYLVDAPGFSLSSTPGMLSLAQNTSATSTITVTGVTGFSGSVTLAASGLPTGVTASFAPGTVTGTQLMTLTASGTASLGGPVMVTVTGTSGLLSATTTLMVTVTAGPGFTMNGTAVSVVPGSVTGNTSTITVTPSGGFTGSVALTASLTASPSGAQDLPTFSFGSTTPVSITGTAAGTATLTITTTAATSGALVYPPGPGFLRYAAGGSALACILLFFVPRRGRNWRRMLGMILLFAGLVGGVFACGGGGSNSGGGGGGGGGGNPGTTPGSYMITVTATSGTITETGVVALTVE
jgi:hypothetical protein